MSRTFRHILHNHWSISPYLKTWIALNDLGYINYVYEKDPRDRYENGFDGISPGYYYSGFQQPGWPENYLGKTRKFFKRRYAKGRRKYSKLLISEQLNDY